MFTVNYIENKKNRVQAEVLGADHTVLNLLVSELWNDSTVTAAAYTIDHPLIGKPKLVVESKDPKKSIVDACKRLKTTNATLKA